MDRAAAKRFWRALFDGAVLIAGAAGAVVMSWTSDLAGLLTFAMVSLIVTAALLAALRVFTIARDAPPVPITVRNILTLLAAFWVNCLAIASTHLYLATAAALTVLIVLMWLGAPRPRRMLQRRQVGPPAIESIP